MSEHSDQWRSRRLTADEVKGKSEAEVLGLAELVYAAAPDFYDLVPLPHERILSLISDQLGAPDSELADVHLLTKGGEVTALFAALPSAVLDRAKRDGTLAIIRRLDRENKPAYMDALEAYTPKVEPLEAENFYLARIAVNIGARRGGAGTAAMESFFRLAGGRPCGLHVKADNFPAISLYRKLGFRFLSDRNFAFRAMLKDLHEPAG